MRCNPAPVLEFGKQVLDLVALSVCYAVWYWFPADPGRRDARFYTLLFQGTGEEIAVVSPVTDQDFSFGQGGQHHPCALVITHLTGCEQHDQRTRVTHGMEF